MSQNLTQNLVSLDTFANRISRRPYFRIGYESIMKNKPYDYDIVDKHAAVDYARGRMFGIWCKQNNAPRAVWRGAVPAKTLVERIIYAAHRKGTFV